MIYLLDVVLVSAIFFAFFKHRDNRKKKKLQAEKDRLEHQIIVKRNDLEIAELRVKYAKENKVIEEAIKRTEKELSELKS